MAGGPASTPAASAVRTACTPGSLFWPAVSAGLVAIAFALAFLQHPGRATSDTKIDLHVDPVGLLADVAAGVLHEHVVQARLAHLEAGDVPPVPVEAAPQGGDRGAGVRIACLRPARTLNEERQGRMVENLATL